MSANTCINWQGNLACLTNDGVSIKSRHTINGKHVFGPDSDYTTLAISGLQLLSDETTIESVKVDGDISEFVLSACGYLIDESAKWTIVCNDDSSISISKGLPVIGSIEGEEIDPGMFQKMNEAWELEMQEVSQGAFVSEQNYRNSSSARMNLQSQLLDEMTIWPPRQMVGSRIPADSKPLSKTGRIDSWTKLAAGGAPSEFSIRAPILDGISTVFVTLDSGPKGVFLLADDEKTRPEIGMRVELVIRKIYAQEGLVRHGLKALIV
tara:strand:+ start:766 stop:1563 length:798 start_codon:yes stop_codon:yes gene_type:complete